MKKSLLLVVLLQLAILAIAQNKKGNIMPGVNFGGITFYSGKAESTSSTTTSVSKSDFSTFYLYVSPYLGFYLTDKFVLGGGLTLEPYSGKSNTSNTTNTNTADSKTTYFYLYIGPFAQLYLGTNNGKGMPYVRAFVNESFYMGYKNTYTPNNGTGYIYKYSKYNNWNAGFTIGYEHFLNTILGFNYALGYSYNNYKYDYTTDYTSGTDYDGTYKSHTGYITFNLGLNLHMTCSKHAKKN